MEELREHTPVLLDAVIKHLDPKDGESYADCTFGAGGYSKAILQAADATIYGIDLDPASVVHASKIKETFPGKKLNFIQGNFANLSEILESVGVHSVDAIIADLGVSSMQIDQAGRGFSFQKMGPLDMRMSQDGVSAYEFINNYPKEELCRVIAEYGEEDKAKQIAHAILNARQEMPIMSTTQLANIIRQVFKGKRGKIDCATKTFQAIRIWVNNELENLKKLLKIAADLLNDGGRLIIISFHSLEDGIVKNFLQTHSGFEKPTSRYSPPSQSVGLTPTFKVLTKKPVTPTDNEINNNIRARSAKLRAALRINKSNQVKIHE